jgi:predicted GNAT family N-acyltransferase
MKAFTFRELTGKKELEEFFGLRYEVFYNSANKPFLNENIHRLDIDYFDVHSKHYCLMHGDNKVGYFRAVYQKGQYFNEKVIEIGEKYELLYGNTFEEQNESAPFPFLSYEGVPESHWNFYYNLLEQDENMAEVSRIIVSPEYRAISTVKLLVECAIVLYAMTFARLRYAIVNCELLHGLFYTHYGFKEIDEAARYTVNGLKKTSLSIAEIPEKFMGKIGIMTEEFKNTGKIERVI